MNNYLKKIAEHIRTFRSNSRDKVKDIFDFLPNGLTLLDIGAAGGIEPRWKNVSKYLNYIGVEPDERSNKGLENQQIFKSVEILNSFAWSEETKIEFNLCRKPMVSSAYLPNRELLDQFPDSQRFDVIKKEILRAEPLSKDEAVQNIDFIKLDIQGGELNALKGLGDSIDNCLGMEIEIEFTEMYKSQPLFGDVHNFLSSKGFYFSDFVNLIKWERDAHEGHGRCIFGDGLWIRELRTLDLKNKEKYLKYAAICSIYGKIDDAIYSLKLLGDDAPKELKNLLLKQFKHQKKERENFKLVKKLWNLYSPGTKIQLIE